VIDAIALTVAHNQDTHLNRHLAVAPHVLYDFWPLHVKGSYLPYIGVILHPHVIDKPIDIVITQHSYLDQGPKDRYLGP
jgi:hypothetical protein